MSRREDIDNSIWVDPEFAPLTPDAKLLYLWSFTNSHCNMSGLYRIAPAALGFGTGLDAIRVSAALRELCDAGFLFYVDCVLWVRSRVKHLRSRSPQMAKSIANDLLKVRSDQELRGRFQREYGSDPWLREELKRAYPDPIQTLSRKPVDKPDSDTLSVPSLEGPGQGQGEGQGSLEIPEGFPQELQPHLRSVHGVLLPLAVRQGAKAVSFLSLASVLMGRPHKPLVKAAYDFAAWADSRSQRRKDVTAGYRNWLDREDDLAGVEPLTSDGLPTSLRDGRVVPMRRDSALEHADRWQAGYEPEEGAA